MAVHEQELCQSVRSKNKILRKLDVVTQSVKDFSRKEHQLSQEMKDTQVKLEGKQKHHRLLRKTLGSLLEKEEQSESEIQMFRSIIEEKEEQICSLEHDLKEKKQELDSTQNQLQQLNEKLDQVTKEFEEKCVQQWQLDAKMEELRGVIVADRKILDSKCQQMAAKAESQERYIQQMQVRQLNKHNI